MSRPSISLLISLSVCILSHYSGNSEIVTVTKDCNFDNAVEEKEGQYFILRSPGLPLGQQCTSLFKQRDSKCWVCYGDNCEKFRESKKMEIEFCEEKKRTTTKLTIGNIELNPTCNLNFVYLEKENDGFYRFFDGDHFPLQVAGKDQECHLFVSEEDPWRLPFIVENV